MLRLTIALGLMSLLAGSLQAGSLIPSTEPLSTSVQKEPVDTIVPIYRAYVTADTGKFAFLLPEQFRLGGDPAHGKVQMENAAIGSQITFTLLRSADDTAPDTGRDAYRERLAARYPQGKFLGEFEQSAIGRKGLGFDVQWKSETGLVQQTRAFYVPTVAGLLELTVTTSTNNSKIGVANLKDLLNSLQGSVDGELKVNHFAKTN